MSDDQVVGFLLGFLIALQGYNAVVNTAVVVNQFRQTLRAFDATQSDYTGHPEPSEPDSGDRDGDDHQSGGRGVDRCGDDQTDHGGSLPDCPDV